MATLAVIAALTSTDHVLIAGAATVSPRTVQRIYQRKPSEATTYARVSEAAAKLGKPQPPPPPVRGAGRGR